MKQIALSLAIALAGFTAAQAAPAKTADPIKQECHKQNPKDHKAYLKCVQDHKEASAPTAAAPTAAK
jgi:hypothetical protein